MNFGTPQPIDFHGFHCIASVAWHPFILSSFRSFFSFCFFHLFVFLSSVAFFPFLSVVSRFFRFCRLLRQFLFFPFFCFSSFLRLLPSYILKTGRHGLGGATVAKSRTFQKFWDLPLDTEMVTFARGPLSPKTRFLGMLPFFISDVLCWGKNTNPC